MQRLARIWVFREEVGTAAGIRGAVKDSCTGRCWLHVNTPLFKLNRSTIMPEVTHPAHKDGDILVNYEEKVFEDVKANPGEKALVTFHGVAHEGSIGLVNTLVATRLLRKGYETSILLYGPGVTMGFQKGFPTLGDEAFPGHLLVNKRLAQFMAEGGKIYACRFSTQALYGQTEKAFIPGIIPINPLDVLDINLIHGRAGAVIIHSWNL
ncbi:MAG: MSMEG_0572 family nitrogen starvation response protein [Prosthecobacter sp.]|nr:MSMEG_0572 family nitrogen starvation response protein [Prosthecobacter sp.]